MYILMSLNRWKNQRTQGGGRVEHEGRSLGFLQVYDNLDDLFHDHPDGEWLEIVFQNLSDPELSFNKAGPK